MLKMEETRNIIVKTVPIIRDLSLNPCCDHGPTILFERDGERFFTCSAYRSRNLCPFYLPETKWKPCQEVEIAESGASRKRRTEKEKSKSNKKPKMERSFNVDNPLLMPNQRDQGEAQYHFNELTVNFFMEQLEILGIDHVLCVGTPSLHEHIVKSGKEGKGNVRSYLLDIDQRFKKLYTNGFSLYNMCNHHFFQGSSDYTEFLANSKNLVAVIDPPFGVKVELIWHGCVQGIQRDLSVVRNTSVEEGNEILGFEVFWIFPYFNEGHILKCSGSKLAMSDFHVEYRNHAKYNGSATKTKSSPIRVFTSVSLSNLKLPQDLYRYCKDCLKWVDKQNLHCSLCETCTTKDGGPTYFHCKNCNKCVKPTWRHCSRCKTCHLSDSTCKKNNQDYSSYIGKGTRKTKNTKKLKKNY